MSYSIELADKLRRKLFKPRVFREHKARFDALDEQSEQFARITWAVHGVCLECRTRGITCGECKECGQGYSAGSRSLQSEAEIGVQISLAKKLVGDR